MKKLFPALCLFACFLLFGAENMGRFDADSACWFVDGGNYSCRFFEGHMFPLRFTLAGAGEMPRCGFGDNITTPSDKKNWRLNMDRWAKLRVLSNTPEEFRVELTGKFCRDARPRMEVLEEVTAVYRWTFRRGRPGFQVEAILRGESGGRYRVNQTLCMNWRETFIDAVRRPGEEKKPVVPGKYCDVRGNLAFYGPRFVVTAKSPRVIGLVSPDAWRTKVMLNAGLWGVDWDGKELVRSAEIEFSSANSK